MKTFKQYIKENMNIISAVQKGPFVYIYGINGLIATIPAGEGLLSFTPSFVNVRDGGMIIIYNDQGLLYNMIPENEEFGFLYKVHHNATINQLKNIGIRSASKSTRFVFDERNNLHCGSADRFCHGDIHESYHNGTDKGFGYTYYDKVNDKHYYEIYNDKVNQANKERLEAYNIHSKTREYEHKEGSKIIW